MVNKKYILSIIVLMLFIGAVVIAGLSFQADKAEAFAQLTTYSATTGGINGTTTPNYMQFGRATTTLIVPTNMMDSLEISLQATASSSLTNFDLTIYTGQIPNGDFYPLNYDTAANSVVSATSSVSIATAGTKYRWVPGATGTSTVAFVIRPTGNYTKIEANVGTSTDVTSRGSIYIKTGGR